MRRKTLFKTLLTATVLLAGYAALASGSITAAPILLVVAYAILIPAVILA